jgi:hypothetical protein
MSNIVPFPGAASGGNSGNNGGASGPPGGSNPTPMAPAGGTGGGPNGGGGGSGSGGGSQPSTDPHAWTKQHVWTIRYNKAYNADVKRRIIYNFIANYENGKSSRGSFIRTLDNRAYLFDARFNKLYRIEPNDEVFGAYMWNAYGLNPSESDTKHIITSLKCGALASGKLRDIRRFTFWDEDTKTLYISRYDGSCYEITGDANIQIVPNGSGSALFIDDDEGKGVDAPVFNDDPLSNIGNHHLLFRHLINDLQYVPTTSGGMSPETQKMCMGIWIFTLAFPDLLPSKPFLLLEGLMGSGKTFAAQRIAMALHGKSSPIQIAKKEDPDFPIKILRSPIAILDDVNTTIDWLQDLLASYATGGKFSRRKLYTDDTEVPIRPHSYFAITTNNPMTFRQPQLADRCLIVRLERRAAKEGFVSAHQLIEQVKFWRSEIFGEWLYWLNEIVAELRKPQELLITKYRLADFARLAYLIGRVFSSHPEGPPGDWSREHVDKMLEAMQTEREALQTEGDSLVDLLDKWLDLTANQGREIKVNDLFRDLANLAKTQATGFYKSPKALAARLREMNEALSAHFNVQQKPGPGGVMLYTFRRLT